MKVEGFTITCQNCGSTDIDVLFSEGSYWSEDTHDPGFASILCNSCHQEYSLDLQILSEGDSDET